MSGGKKTFGRIKKKDLKVNILKAFTQNGMILKEDAETSGHHWK